MKKIKAISLLMAILFVLSLGGVLAKSSTNYAIKWDVIGGGGGPIRSSSYSLKSTLGQGAIGSSRSSSYQLGGGYWCVVAPAPPIKIFLPIIMKNYLP